jgi:hypothetical protein
MLHPTHKIALAVILFGLLLLPNAMWGQKEPARSVKDEAKLFSEKGIEKANSVIAKIKDKHHKDLWIETLEKLPDNEKPAKWAQKRVEDAGMDGVYIVITTKPKHFEFYVSNKTRDSGLFTIADRDELIKILKGNLGKKNDEALLKVANYTLEALNKRSPKAATGEFARFIGEWVGPPVEIVIRSPKLSAIREINAKGQLYLRFSDIQGKPYLDLGYVRTENSASIGVFRNCLFEMKENGKDRQIVIRNANEEGSVVLTYELADDTLRITSSGKVAVSDVKGLVDLSGEWKRLAQK